MMTIDPTLYGPVFEELLSGRQFAGLVADSPNTAAETALGGLTLEDAFSGFSVRNAQMALACFCGLWIYHDFQEPAHRLCQSISNPTGCYWHGILHRRQPDFKNANYWFRRTGEHVIHPRLAAQASVLAAAEPSWPGIAFLTDSAAWDAQAFTDLCEASIAGHAPAQRLCLAIQQLEWELLFDYCFQQAIGNGEEPQERTLDD